MRRLVMIGGLAVLLTGCESFLDVNTDPNNPTEVGVSARLAPVVLGVVHSAYYGDPSGWGVEWVQQTSYNRPARNYEQIQYYELQDNSADDWWSFHYAGLLNETKAMMEETDPRTDGAYHGLAKFIFAWTWALTTDLWGPVPFAEALDPGGAPSPAYDPQPVIYEAVDRWFDEAAEEMVDPATLQTPGSSDLLFHGDMPRWVRLLRHVQARHALRLTNAPWADAQVQAQAALDALAEGFTSNADNAILEYGGATEGVVNPLWRFQVTGNEFKASQRTVEGMRSRNDPRLGILVDPTLAGLKDDTIIYRGHPNGPVAFPDSTISTVGVYFTADDAPLRVASFADAKFMEAEARLILNGPAAADAPYREGIQADMERLGVSAGSINTYLASRPALSQVVNPLAEIIWEKGLGNYLSVEPWNDWRRTGFPVLQPVPQRVLPSIPIRIRTPQSELATNREHVLETGISPDLEGMLWTSDEAWWGHD